MNVQESALTTKPFYHEEEQAVGPSPTPMLSSTAAIESSYHGAIRTPLHVLSPQEQQAVLEQNHEAYKQWQMHHHPQSLQEPHNHKEEAPMKYNQDVREYNQQLVREWEQHQKEAMERYYQQLVLQTNQQTPQST